jgi:hypothetical protein
MDVADINTVSYKGLFGRVQLVKAQHQKLGAFIFFILGFLPFCYIAHGIYLIVLESNNPPLKTTYEQRTKAKWKEVVICPHIYDDIGAKLVAADVHSTWGEYETLSKSARIPCWGVNAKVQTGYMEPNVECVYFNTTGRPVYFENDAVKNNDESKMGMPQISFRAVWQAKEDHGYDFNAGVWVGGGGPIGTVAGYQEAKAAAGLTTQFDLAPRIVKQSDFWCHKSTLRHDNCSLGDGWSFKRLLFGEEKYDLKRSVEHGIDIMHFETGFWGFRWGDENYEHAKNFACSPDLNVKIDRSNASFYEVQTMIQMFSTKYTIEEIVAVQWRIMDFLSNGFAFTCMMLGLFTMFFIQWPQPTVPDEYKLQPVWTTGAVPLLSTVRKGSSALPADTDDDSSEMSDIPACGKSS